MTIQNIITEIELLAPLSRQEDFDNSGLQVGDSLDSQCTGVLVCLDITEEVVDEAIEKGCNLIVSHHPLLFHPLRQVSSFTLQQRCTVKALRNNIAIYSSHTSLDNSKDGVNYRIAAMLGVKNLEWLVPQDDPDAGSGVTGTLEEAEKDIEFLKRVKRIFEVKSLMHSPLDGRQVRKIAICGGAGAFLLDAAEKAGADCFLTGELHYHDYFDRKCITVAFGHYESEHFTRELLCEWLKKRTDARIIITSIDTNAVQYL